MTDTVRLGDSFASLAERMLGDASRWSEIERANQLPDMGVLLVDQQVRPPLLGGRTPSLTVTMPRSQTGPQVSEGLLAGRHGRGGRPALVPAHSYVFIVADEVNPLSGKAIRRVITSKALAAEVAKQIGKPVHVFPNPERFGFAASDPAATLSPGRHAQGIKPSPMQSASRAQPLGARRFAGRPFWIDEAKARQAGVTIHETSEIVADLERIIVRTNPAGQARLREIIRLVKADQEVLLHGTVPARAIKGGLTMGATRVLQGVQIIGFVISAVSLEQAAHRSFDQHSVRPLAAETVRQVGGWASAWAGMKLGALGGAALGIETGPGAVLTAAGGGVIGGLAGYFGFGWIADHMEAH